MKPDPVPGHPVLGMHLWGWMSPEELTWLHETAAEMTSVVEVGSLHGRSAFALLAGCPGPVYCIDPWDDPDDLCYGSFMGACGAFTNLVAIRGLSPQAADEVPGTVDMVFLDGAHDRDSVENDIDVWLPKTERLICGHDFTHDGYPDVREVVAERFPDVQVAPGTSIWTVEL